MSVAKPIDELTIDDLKRHPIWEWDFENEDSQDETWIKPASTSNFTEELNGSIVLGELTLNTEESCSIMCEMELLEKEVLISTIVLYNKMDNEYYALQDRIKNLDMPLSIAISININGEPRDLSFAVDKILVYKNNIRTYIY
ncbi:hypothetical protein O0Q50_23710 [Priestia aryabhattai]|uniref:Uncharacterized protein n=1 Tax=Priestia aryabhattai TaxID=412384 RepID=A0AAX6NEM9_PRIAR|nr:hypothetical protein [Priestia aryabhattai]MDU9694196.1 hypothetical protein [Priestia aryabhattai]